jgi:pentatricopeptide repeat protein
MTTYLPNVSHNRTSTHARITTPTAGQPQRALSLLRLMTHERGLAPSLQCLTSAIAALCHGANAPTGRGGGGNNSSSNNSSTKRPAAPIPAPIPPPASVVTEAGAPASAAPAAPAAATGGGTGTAAPPAAPPQQLLSQAEGLLREAESLVSPPLDAAPYTALMAAHNRRGSPHKALRLYRRMRRRGVEPTASALTQVLLACRRTMDAGGVYQALRLLRSKGWHLRPERGLYQAALTACYCEGDEEMGRGLREEALRLYGMEVGGEEEVVERAVKWGVALPPASPPRGAGGGGGETHAGGRVGGGGGGSSLRAGRRKK